MEQGVEGVQELGAEAVKLTDETWLMAGRWTEQLLSALLQNASMPGLLIEDVLYKIKKWVILSIFTDIFSLLYIIINLKITEENIRITFVCSYIHLINVY